MTDWLFYALLAVFGLVFGSFANVVIWRFPRGESVATPGSHCPSCGTPIGWRDNIPVVSWLLLSARCRQCGEPISPRYPAVELLSGGLWVLAGVLYGQTWRCVLAVALFYLLLILSFIDWDTMRLPNPLVALLAVVGLVGAGASLLFSAPIGPLTSERSDAGALVVAIAGAILGAGVSLGIAMLYSAVRKADGFGMGDVKLLGAMGLYLGPLVLLALFAGSLLGAVYGIVAMRAKGLSLRSKVPFGPFLAIGGVLVAAFGPAIWSWYAGML